MRIMIQTDPDSIDPSWSISIFIIPIQIRKTVFLLFYSTVNVSKYKINKNYIQHQKVNERQPVLLSI